MHAYIKTRRLGTLADRHLRIASDLRQTQMHRAVNVKAYINKRQAAGEKWVFSRTHKEHSHGGNSDPFSYPQHKDNQGRYGETIARVMVHRGTASLQLPLCPIRRENLPISSRHDYYNFRRKADHGTKLSRDQEVAMTMAWLEDEIFYADVRADVRAKYVLNA